MSSIYTVGNVKGYTKPVINLKRKATKPASYRLTLPDGRKLKFKDKAEAYKYARLVKGSTVTVVK